MSKTYQWLKGDRTGEIVEWEGEIIQDGEINFLVFKDSSRVNEALLNDYIIEIPSRFEPFIDANDMKPQKTLPPEKNPPLQKVVKQEPPKASQSPIANLLQDSKKTKSTISIDIVADIPGVELMRVLADSYEDGEKQVLDYLANSINVEDIKQQVARQIWLQAFSKSQKRKPVKNEAI